METYVIYYFNFYSEEGEEDVGLSLGVEINFDRYCRVACFTLSREKIDFPAYGIANGHYDFNWQFNDPTS
jgi:hypothetical protein